VSINHKCKIEKCHRLGQLDAKTNQRYFIKGYCATHYNRQRLNIDLHLETRFDNRPAVNERGYAKIPLGLLSKKEYTLVDKEYTYLDKYKWRISKTGYVVGYIDTKPVQLHRIIIGAKDGEEVDHINRDTLDNRLKNLRIVTSRQNKINRGNNSNNTSGYRGVRQYKNYNKWHASITVDYKIIYLGTFNTPLEAAKAYDIAVKKYHDSFAPTNFNQH